MVTCTDLALCDVERHIFFFDHDVYTQDCENNTNLLNYDFKINEVNMTDDTYYSVNIKPLQNSNLTLQKCFYGPKIFTVLINDTICTSPTCFEFNSNTTNCCEQVYNSSNCSAKDCINAEFDMYLQNDLSTNSTNSTVSINGMNGTNSTVSINGMNINGMNGTNSTVSINGMNGTNSTVSINGMNINGMNGTNSTVSINGMNGTNSTVSINGMNINNTNSTVNINGMNGTNGTNITNNAYLDLNNDILDYFNYDGGSGNGSGNGSSNISSNIPFVLPTNINPNTNDTNDNTNAFIGVYIALGISILAFILTICMFCIIFTCCIFQRRGDSNKFIIS